MKKFSIYLHIEEWDDAEIIEKQFKKAKKIFLKAIEEPLLLKKIVLCKTQETLNAIDLRLQEEFLEEMVSLFRSIAVVKTIDAEYLDPKGD